MHRTHKCGGEKELFAHYFLLLEVIVWEFHKVNGSEIEAESAFNDVETFRDGGILSKVEKRSAKQAAAAGFPTKIDGSSARIYNRPIPGRIAKQPIGGRGPGKNVGVNDLINPVLLRGSRLHPGIKIRINRRSFQYASTLAGQILNREIIRFPIPDIHQKIEEICSEATICNNYISNYRPPKRLHIFPSPPNHIVLTVEDLDIGVTGNLDGVANIILPIQLFGIAHANFYHVSATITLQLGRSRYGAPELLIAGCNINIPYADVCISNGGLVGEISNLLFRQIISERTRIAAQGIFCSLLPQVINTRVNPLLARIPQSVSLTQIANLIGGLQGGSVPAHCHSPECQARLATARLPPPSVATLSPPPSNDVPPMNIPPLPAANNKARSFVAKTASSGPTEIVAQKMQSNFLHNVGKDGKKVQSFSTTEEKNSNNAQYFNKSTTQMVLSATHWSTTKKPSSDQQRSQQTVVLYLSPIELPQRKQQQQLPASVERKTINRADSHTRTSYNQLAIRGVPLAVPTPKGYNGISSYYKSNGLYRPAGGFRGEIRDPCAGCPVDSAEDSLGILGNLIKQQLDLKKVANLVLTTQLLRAYATYNDYSLDLNGEFSPNGRGGTPFGPFPMHWPEPVGSSMIEILISDFTINSLLFWMFKANFISFRVGPETPGIGALLTTACDIGNDYSGEELENETLFIRLLRLSQRRRHHDLFHHQHSKRQAITDSDSNLGSLSDLADLGICLGDIIPVIKEKYPNRTLALLIHPARAPSVIISGRHGGNVQVDLILFVDIYLDKTNIRVGTITVTVVADIMVRMMGQRIIANASLPIFRLMDRDQTLGLPQDTLDNLASLANDIILKAINQQLNKGIQISLPTLTYPINIISPNIRILEHSIHISSDFMISPSALPMFS